MNGNEDPLALPYEQYGHPNRLTGHWAGELQRTVRSIHEDAGKPGIHRILRTQFAFLVKAMEGSKTDQSVHEEAVNALASAMDTQDLFAAVDPDVLGRLQTFLDTLQTEIVE